jgi:hypothetical protein
MKEITCVDLRCAQFAVTPGANGIAVFDRETCRELNGYIPIDVHVGLHIQSQLFSSYLHKALQ